MLREAFGTRDGAVLSLESNVVAGYRYVHNSPTNLIDPSGQQEVLEKGVGHHWLPVTVFMQPGFGRRLTTEAKQYAAGAYTTPLDPQHCNKTYGGISHPKYNELVATEFKNFMAGKSNKVTAAEMKEFIDNIKQGKGADGKIVPGIKSFNDAIKSDIKDPPKPSKIKEIIESGKKYMQTNRFRLLAMAAVLAGALADVVVSHAQILSCTANSQNYRDALEALEQGDLNRARDKLIGENHSVYVDILGEAGAHPALNFRKAIEKAFERANDAEAD